MKNKIILISLFVILFSAFHKLWAAGYGSGSYTIISKIGPVTSTADVTISTPAAGRFNCLTDMVVISTQAYTLRILEGGTTVYAITLAANDGIIMSWDINDPYCTSSAAMSMTIKTSTSPYQLSYRGVVRR